MHIGWPQGIYLALCAIGLIVHLLKHGEPRTDTFNFHSSALGTIIVVALLYWGGFFS